MMPWGHFAVAFLPYAAYRLLVHRSLPSRRAALLLLVASQFPDIVDKPLAWNLYILPSGRSLAHSVLVAVPLVVLGWALARRLRRPALGALFAFGYLSHLYADYYRVVLSVPMDDWPIRLAGLYWPLLPVEPDASPAFLPHFAGVGPTRWLLVGLGLLVIGLVYGLGDLRRAVEARLDSGR